MRWIRKVSMYVRFLWHSLFMGMSAADSIIKAPPVNGSAPESVRHQEAGGVFSDFLKGKETEQTVEMRDKMYRVMREAEKYDVSDITVRINGEDDDMEFITPHHLRRKTKADFANHADVMNPEGYPIRTIQDNRKSETNSMFSVEIPAGAYDFVTTISVERNGITPRFPIEKYAKRVVVRTAGEDRCLIDIYLPYDSSQFGKVDAILVSNLHQMMESGRVFNDITDFKGISWYSDRAWNCEDMCLFKYQDVKPLRISVYDGSFVITFSCKCEVDGKYVGEKYETSALSAKYVKKETKSGTIDMSTAIRMNAAVDETDEYSTVRLTIS